MIRKTRTNIKDYADLIDFFICVIFDKKALLLLIASSFLLFGCKLVTQPPKLLTESSRVDRDDAIFLLGGQPRTLDPAKTLGGPGGALGLIFSGLVTLDADLQVQPELAAGWE
ncbi:hypothetical protein MNBD_CHLOROFLEXI01-1283, partial [hydrothermal vent metagenome]